VVLFPYPQIVLYPEDENGERKVGYWETLSSTQLIVAGPPLGKLANEEPKEVIWILMKYIIFTSKFEFGTVNEALYRLALVELLIFAPGVVIEDIRVLNPGVVVDLYKEILKVSPGYTA